MIQRYFIYFSYDGSHYHGWQVQPNGHSVQAELQRALSVLLQNDIQVVGAGRTDTGVHARKMVAHFDVDSVLDVEHMTYKLNRLLPKDMAVYKLVAVNADMHARFSAKWRTYHYYIHLDKDPFCRNYSYQLYRIPDFDLMNEAAAYLCTVEDFGSFCKSNSDAKTTLCTLTKAHWVEVTCGKWYFEVTANRFLRNMVRALVGTLLEVGYGKISIEEFKRVIASKSRSNAGESVPGYALFLEDVVY